MRLLRYAVALSAALAASPSAAQLSNRGIAVESGVCAPLRRAGSLRPTLAISASTWLEGDVEAVARVAFSSAGETAGRDAVPALAGTLGLRLSLGRAPVRPQLFAEGGWARVEAVRGAANRATLGLGGALEWFPASDLSAGVRAALRLTGAAAALEIVVALGGYF